MKSNSIIFITLVSVISILSMVSCQNVLKPEDENWSTGDRLYEDPAFAEGLLITSYVRIPLRSLTFNEVATDDAVSNVKTNSYLRMATGQWSASNNPMSQWDNSISSIFYLNKFMALIDTVEWKWTSPQINELYKKRFYGEAYALRGLFELCLLQATAGIAENGELMGIPIYRKFVESSENFNIPRLPFKESVDSIYADFDRALQYLTMDDYKDISNEGQLPEGYEKFSVAEYNEIFGSRTNQRIDGKSVKALKAKLALLAASPSFNPSNDVLLWEKAAVYAADVLNKINGVNGLDPDGHKYFQSSLIDQISLSNNKDQKEVLWRTSLSATNSFEKQCFPPSLYGSGDVNPTQNFVDAFPTSKGFPILHSQSKYKPDDPYINRDPRLALYVIYNNSTFKGTPIITASTGDLDAKDATNQSTRTGYYLKKLLREDISLNPVSTTSLNHYIAMIRYTEIFLIYAEAANEAWGPNQKSANASYSARDVMTAIRKRAGISQPDEYLTSIASDKNEMRKLIRNERRIELSFEGFRFWDLRRWGENLTESTSGVDIDDIGYNYVNVEPRVYDNSYMHYGPLPEREVLKFNALLQNKGWN